MVREFILYETEVTQFRLSAKFILWNVAEKNSPVLHKSELLITFLKMVFIVVPSVHFLIHTFHVISSPSSNYYYYYYKKWSVVTVSQYLSSS